MADWREKFAKIEANEKPQVQSPQEEWRHHYNILTNLAAQANKPIEWLNSEITTSGCEITTAPDLNINGLNTERAEIVKEKIKAILADMEKIELGEFELGKLSDRADLVGKYQWILPRYTELGISCRDVDEVGNPGPMRVEGLTERKYHLLMWEMSNFAEQKNPTKSTRRHVDPEASEPARNAPETQEEKEYKAVKTDYVRRGLTGAEVDEIRSKTPAIVDIVEGCESLIEAKVEALKAKRNPEPAGPEEKPQSEPDPRQPVDTYVENKPQLPALVDEDGQILDIEAYADMLDIRLPENLRNPAEIHEFSEKDAEWVVGRIRAAQRECEDLAFQALAKIKTKCQAIEGLYYHYGILLRNFAEPRLPRNKKGENIGKLKKKNLPLGPGTIFFAKTGGVKLADSGEWQMFREKLVEDVTNGLRPSSDINYWFIKLNISYDYQKVRAAVKNGRTDFPGWTVENEMELGELKIGGANEKLRQQAWSLKTLKTNIGKRLSELQIKGQTDDEETEEE